MRSVAAIILYLISVIVIAVPGRVLFKLRPIRLLTP